MDALTDDYETAAPSAQQRRGFIRGGALVLTGGILAARPNAAWAQGEVNSVPETGLQAADTFLPVFTRTPAERPAGSVLGFFTGTTRLEGVVDPFVALGYFAGPNKDDWGSTLQLEADWKTPSGSITELYWQLVKPDGSSRRPLYGRYDRTLGRAIQWQFMVGNGIDAAGAADPAFSVNWDDDSGPVGTNCFSVTPNRINLYAVSSGGIAAAYTRLNMYSAPSNGSTFALSYGGADPESSNVTFKFQAVTAAASGMYSQGKPCIYFSNDGTVGAIGFFGASAMVRPAAYTQTYATADRTLGAYRSDPESSAYTGAADGEAKLADLNALRVAYENLRAFAEDLAQHHNAMLDDLQAYGLLA